MKGVSSLKIGMISFAHHHAYSYADSLKQLSEVEIIGIYDNNQSRGKQAAQRYDTKFFNNLSHLLETDVEAVVICSENSLHMKHVMQSANAKKHILCEKPIATNVTDAKKMIDCCKKNNVILQIAFPVRFCEPIATARRIVKEGKLGKIQAIRTTNRGQNPLDWFVDPQLSGGGAVLDHTVHMADIIRWFTGKEFAEVHAEVDTFFENTPVEDTGILNMMLSDGTIVTHDCSWSRSNNFPTWGDVTIELFGSKGHLKVDAFSEHFLTYQDEGKASQQVFFGSNMDFGLIRDFVSCVIEQREPSITGNDGLKAMEVGLVAYQSAAEGKSIKF